jgi:predicted esterase
MRTFFKLEKNHTFSKSYLLCIVFFAVIGDFNSLFSQYSSRQIAKQVPYGYHTKFWAYTPSNYSNKGDGFPLLISLHGGSAIGDNLTMLFERTHENPAQLIHINRWFDLPFIVVSPQLKRDQKVPHYNQQNWPPDLVDEVIEYVKREYNVDPNRIYVTGISSGSAGTWNYAVAYPEKVAAILPLGGQAPLGSDSACVLKDIPIWAFHGENDVFVPTRFTKEMIKAISECAPAGKYVPHANISYSVEHEVWDQVYNLTGGYDVYNWLLSFKKGDHTNKLPFVYAGLNRKMRVHPGPFYLTAEYFDSDGAISNIKWSQVNNGSELLELENTDSKFLKILRADKPGTYVFRLTVTDNHGAVSFDDISITLLNENETRAVVKLSLTNQTGTTVYGDLANDQVYDLKLTGNKINILATTQGFNSRIRWSVNCDQNTRQVNQWFFLTWANINRSYIRPTTTGEIKAGWTVTKGEYLICATAFANINSNVGPEGTSLCYKITFSDDAASLTPGVDKGMHSDADTLDLSVTSYLEHKE